MSIGRLLIPQGSRNVSKPCARTPRCTEAVYAYGPKTLAKKRYCSHRCSYLARVEAGTWHMPTMTTEQRRQGGRMAGRISGEHRRQLAVLRAAEAIADLLPAPLRQQIGDRGERLVRVLLGRAWRRGYRTGYTTGAHQARQKARRPQPRSLDKSA